MRPIFYKLLFSTVLIIGLSGCGSLVKKSSTSSPDYSKLPDFSKQTSSGSEDITKEALSLLGTPYKWGGNTPQTGFDCSGFVVYVVKKVRRQNLPRTTDDLGKYGISLKNQSPAPGDLVFFDTLGTPYSHVGIYVGNGRFVHAPTSGGFVRVEEIKNPYWGPKYTEARRIVQ
jgi:cell wall-associated NlpC family hydrolase